MKKWIVANWKMNKLRCESLAFIQNISLKKEVEIAIIPPFLSISEVKAASHGTGIKVGAQNMSEFSKGPYTGEVSASMLKEVGCDFVLLGHSERRSLFLENGKTISNKVKKAVEEKLPFILCVGETLEENKKGHAEEIVSTMLYQSLSSISSLDFHLVTIAYEPVWAIGTKKACSIEIISKTHTFIKDILKDLAKDGVNIPKILYGGSVDSKNIKAILSIPNVDGALVGGASLEALSFNQLINEAVV